MYIVHSYSLMAEKLFKALKRPMHKNNAKTQILTLTVRVESLGKMITMYLSEHTYPDNDHDE